MNLYGNLYDLDSLLWKGVNGNLYWKWLFTIERLLIIIHTYWLGLGRLFFLVILDGHLRNPTFFYQKIPAISSLGSELHYENYLYPNFLEWKFVGQELDGLAWD